MGSRRSRTSRGFTLIELLVVVAILGILSVIVVPKLIEAFNRSKQRATGADMRTISIGLEAYLVDFSFYPAAANIQELKVELQSYPFTVPTEDGWLTPYNYTHTNGSSGPRTYSVESYGRDRADGPANLSQGQLFQYDNDIIVSNGTFTAWVE